jgi:cell division transport system ATP-binding protein
MDLLPTEGRVSHFGRTLRRGDRNAIAALRRSIGVVHQDGRLLDHLSLIDNIALPLRASGVAPDVRAADLEALLEWVDLPGRAAARPGALSAGERQRAALARAVILSPEILLADEPTGDADQREAQRLLELLLELNRMGKTVLVATHDPGLARAIDQRVPAQVLRLGPGQPAPAEACA